MVSLARRVMPFDALRGVGLVFGILMASLFVTKSDGAQQDARPIVAGFERFYSGDRAATPAGGRLLLGELSCTTCHAASPQMATQIFKKQAPVLDAIGQRVRPEYLRRFIMNPHQTKPGTTMPNLLSGQSAEKTERQVEALVHLLASTGEIQESAPIPSAAMRGEKLFHSIGCVACHNPRTEGAPSLETSIPLPPVMEEKYSVPSLAEFLSNPLHVRPSGRMPHLNLTQDESRDLACYLLRDLKVEGTLKFTYFEGNWQTLPNFDRLNPKSRGMATSFDVNVGAANHFGLTFDGLFRVQRDGEYRFFLGSDDGSRLQINGKKIVEQDGIHPLSFGEGRVELTAGVHEIHLEYFEQGGEQELRVEFEGPGLKRQSVEFALVASRNEPSLEKRFVVNNELVAEGARLFGTLGCAACHQLRPAAADEPLASQHRARSVDALNLAAPAGCLGNAKHPGIPDFALTAHQTKSVTAALADLRTTKRAASDEVITQTLTVFNCRACHARDQLGGVESARNSHFQSNQPEMGDEGRIPPTLDGVGAKLKKEWLKHLFNNGAKDRPYMYTRMPRFGEGNVGDLISAFETADATSSPPEVKTELSDRRLKAAGRKLVGAQGFSCIKCHTWGKIPATGIQSIGMTTMARRLKQGWFETYLLDPQAYRPGTRMPAAWPQGQVVLAKLLDGQAATQIHSVWKYLSDGDQAAIPTGLASNPIQLLAIDEPVLYRNFIAGAGPRAIGVGYPERVNVAYDANNMRLALIWHNAFIDAAKHWRGRGPGYQTPLGDNVLKLHDGAPVATLPDLDTSWPTQPAKQLDHHFLGYRLDKQRRPIFKYRVDDMLVEDFCEPLGDREFAPLRRTLTFAAPQAKSKLWFRAMVANSIELAGKNEYRIDGQWTMKVISSGDTPRIRQLNGTAELLVPIITRSPSDVVTQEFIW